MLNPNQILLDVVNEQPIPSSFVVFDLTTTKPTQTSQIVEPVFSGGAINTPFIQKNADAVKVTSKFWITNVRYFFVVYSAMIRSLLFVHYNICSQTYR